MKIRATQTVLIAFLAIGSSANLFCQSSAAVTGNVTDSSGAAVADAPVQAQERSTGEKRSTHTNGEGYYTIPQLSPGVYDVTVKAQGFKATTRSGISLEIAQTARVDLSLQVGQVQEQVVVHDSAPMLQTENASMSQLIGQKAVLDLPLNGRNFTSLTTLVPGTVSGGTQSLMNSTAIHVNGMRNSATAFSIDGVSTVSQIYDGVPLTPAPDAIMEFKINSNNMSAEYGQGGAAVEVQLRSGTNDWHGGAYEFLRNDKIDAKNFFATKNPPLRQNQFGALLGGPVVKNRTFFFLDYEGTLVRSSKTINDVVPTEAERGGDFSALHKTITDPSTGEAFSGNRIQPSMISPQALYFLQFLPLPNTPGGTYVQNLASTSNTHQYDIRLDHYFSQRDQITGSYSYQTISSFSPGSLPANGGLGANLAFHRAGLNEIHTFSPTIVNEFRAGYFHDFSTQTPQGLGTDHAGNAGIGGLAQTSAEAPGFPQLSISGYTGINGNTYYPITTSENTYELRDYLTWVKGSHTIKGGVYLRQYRVGAYNVAYSRGVFNFNGSYSGDGAADFLLGIPYSASRSFPRETFGGTQNSQSLFVQDDWKVTRTLTLNLGLRYDLNHPAAFLYNQAASTDFLNRRIIVASDASGQINLTSQQITKYIYPLFADIIVPSSKAGVPSSLRQLDTLNVAPRLGAALQLPFKFVLRAGYGIQYPLEQGNQVLSTGVINIPFLADELNQYNTTPRPMKTLANFFPPYTMGDITLASIGSPSFFDLNPSRRNPYIQQYNFTIQKSLGGFLSLEAAYVGSKGTALSLSTPLNTPLPGPGSIQARRAWTVFGQGYYLDNTANSNYNALQTKVEVRNRRGLTLLSSYTYGKSISDQAGDFQNSTVQDPNNVAAERARDSWDQRHLFVTSLTYELPFLRQRKGLVGSVLGGWNASSIISIASGLPFTPTISVDSANTGTSYRPNRVGSGLLSDPTINQWFDVAAFTVPAQYTFGNSGNNILDGPATKNWDFGLLKNFAVRKIDEGAFLQFRAEFFNFTNTPHFGLPNTNIQTTTAGRILSAGPARVVQFALKLSF